MVALHHHSPLENSTLDVFDVIWKSNIARIPRPIPRAMQAEEKVVIRVDHARQPAEWAVPKPPPRINTRQSHRKRRIDDPRPSLWQFPVSHPVRTEFFHPLPRAR